MSSNAFAQSTAILDAAGSGTLLDGHEGIGELLIDLGRTTPVPAGAAIRSTGVAAATSASAATPGVATLVLSFVRPISIVLTTVVVGGALAIGLPKGSSPDVIPTPSSESGEAEQQADDSPEVADRDDDDSSSPESIPSTVAGLVVMGDRDPEPVAPETDPLAAPEDEPAAELTSPAPTTTVHETGRPSDDDDDDDDDESDESAGPEGDNGDGKGNENGQGNGSSGNGKSDESGDKKANGDAGD